MRIAIHQPQYLPWMGFFDKMDSADIFVILDDAQYKKNEWQNRNRIRSARSWQWLTVPVRHDFGQAINEIKINNDVPWREKHLKSIELNYSRAPFFSEYFPFFQSVFSEKWDNLADINIKFIEYFARVLGIKTRVALSSELNISSKSTQRLIDICRIFSADEYLSGAGAGAYLDIELFRQSGIKLEFQKYRHPVYAQVYAGFEPYMSAADVLFCHGGESLSIIRQGGKVYSPVPRKGEK